MSVFQALSRALTTAVELNGRLIRLLELVETESGETPVTLKKLIADSERAISELRFYLDVNARSQIGTVTCNCGCGATKPNDGRCECGKPIGHS